MASLASLASLARSSLSCAEIQEQMSHYKSVEIQEYLRAQGLVYNGTRALAISRFLDHSTCSQQTGKEFVVQTVRNLLESAPRSEVASALNYLSVGELRAVAQSLGLASDSARAILLEEILARATPEPVKDPLLVLGEMATHESFARLSCTDARKQIAALSPKQLADLAQQYKVRNVRDSRALTEAYLLDALPCQRTDVSFVQGWIDGQLVDASSCEVITHRLQRVFIADLRTACQRHGLIALTSVHWRRRKIILDYDLQPCFGSLNCASVYVARKPALPSLVTFHPAKPR
jgi:hypothetical protein